MTFPANPTRGDTHTHDDTIYVYNGVDWDRSVIGSNNSTDYGSNLLQDTLDAVQADVDANETAAAALVATLGAARDVITNAISARVTTLEADPTTATALAVVQADVDANETAADTSLAALGTNLNNEGAARLLADNALGVRVTALEADPTTATALAAVQADVDANETASDAAEAALSGRLDVLEADPVTQSYVDTQVAGLINSAPGALNTLDELAAALNDDANFAATITNSIAAVQLDVDANETDSDAAEAALSTRLDTLEADPTTATAVAAVQADVDANESWLSAAIALRAPLASPAFTGLLTSPAIDLVNADSSQVGFDLHNNISNQYAADISTNNWGVRIISDSTNSGSSVLDVRTGDGVAFRVDNDQSIHLDGGLTDAADDTAAASAGVAVSQLYRNGSVVMIRVS